VQGKVPVVSVVIPAYNASRWIAKTVACVQSQTIEDIEIIVVDDGSTDDTWRIVTELAAADRRIVPVQQANGGVARARNAGLALVRSPYVALLDADDLWHPTRLEAHLKAFAQSDDSVGIVYSPYVNIDENDYVISGVRLPLLEGWVFDRHLYFNPVANGSGITARTAVLREVGGYSSALREADAQGYEDWLIQLKVAVKYRFKVVPAPLVAYRKAPGNMTGNFLTMRRSNGAAIYELANYIDPSWRPLLWIPAATAASWQVLVQGKAHRWGSLVTTMVSETAREPLVIIVLPIVLVNWATRKVRGWLRNTFGAKSPFDGVTFDRLTPAMLEYHQPTLAARAWLVIADWMGRLVRGGASLPVATSKLQKKGH
jgi:glycosyltransferase involved in cell wall biosynthesis